ncbi:dihydrolipoamide acetyltransferase family protein [uncultured Ilumatobacter sp.]|jgi:pyruvate dehydrogenase E2 component (dihydrolipoamide acetyltransferase)|uniref:dihydrolipoamide acetyltransferase family protein n=1 Tax=uncultured Ilumatobacter sp. TaxID=879968 RepID=UPI00374F74E3
MATEFVMPKLGLTMEEGTITEWLVADGDTVTAGSAVLRIETDKTETDVDAAETGRLHIVGQAGDTFVCGERIGWFLGDGEDAPASDVSSSSPPASTTATTAATPTTPIPAVARPTAVASTGRIIASPLAKRLADERSIDLRTLRGTGPEGRIVAADLDDVAARPVTTVHVAGGGVAATFAARQLADLVGVDLTLIPVDPIEGRVTKDAVAVYVRGLINTLVGAARPPVQPPAQVALQPATQDPTAVIKLSGMRGTIAKRMHSSLRDMAQLTLQMDADLDAVVADRIMRKAAGPAPSYTDYVIAAAARALVAHPIANSQVTDDGIALLPTVHVGMAVALDGGLIVPVITNTAARSLDSLSAESTRLAEAARAGALTLPELEGGTFSVSTLGMFGVDGFTPVINPPNTAILGVGRLRDDVVLDESGGVSTITRVTLSLTWDHRAFDGAPAAAFCKTIVELLGDPVALNTPAG